jgi:hypothetical protein
MIVFENPGPPGGKNMTHGGQPDPQLDYTIADVTLPDALSACIRGQNAWLFQSVQLDKTKWDNAGFVIGETVFTTDSHKCPDPNDAEKKKRKHEARQCCVGYLKEEIRLVQPRAIIAFGDCARRSIEEAEGVKWPAELKLKLMSDDDRVICARGRLYAVLPHPNGLWRNPPITKEVYEAAIGSVFQRVKIFLSGQCVSHVP